MIADRYQLSAVADQRRGRAGAGHPSPVRTIAGTQSGRLPVVAQNGHRRRGHHPARRHARNGYGLGPLRLRIIVHRKIKRDRTAVLPRRNGDPKRVGTSHREILALPLLRLARTGTTGRRQLHHHRRIRRSGLPHRQSGGDDNRSLGGILLQRRRGGRQSHHRIIIVQGDGNRDYAEGSGRTGKGHRLQTFPAPVIHRGQNQIQRTASLPGRDGNRERPRPAFAVRQREIRPGGGRTVGGGQGNRHRRLRPFHALPQSGRYRQRRRPIVFRRRRLAHRQHDVRSVVVRDGHRRVARRQGGSRYPAAGESVNRGERLERLRHSDKQPFIALRRLVIGDSQVERSRTLVGPGGNGDREMPRRSREIGSAGGVLLHRHRNLEGRNPHRLARQGHPRRRTGQVGGDRHLGGPGSRPGTAILADPIGIHQKVDALIVIVDNHRNSGSLQTRRRRRRLEKLIPLRQIVLDQRHIQRTGNGAGVLGQSNHPPVGSREIAPPSRRAARHRDSDLRVLRQQGYPRRQTHLVTQLNRTRRLVQKQRGD